MKGELLAGRVKTSKLNYIYPPGIENLSQARGMNPEVVCKSYLWTLHKGRQHTNAMNN